MPVHRRPGDQRGRRPMSEPYAGPQTLATTASAIASRYIGGRPGLVDEDQRVGIEVALALEPLLAVSKDIGTIPLRGVASFLRVILWRAKNRHTLRSGRRRTVKQRQLSPADRARCPEPERSAARRHDAPPQPPPGRDPADRVIKLDHPCQPPAPAQTVNQKINRVGFPTDRDRSKSVLTQCPQHRARPVLGSHWRRPKRRTAPDQRTGAVR